MDNRIQIAMIETGNLKPVEVEYSETEFAILGEMFNRRTIFMKSKSAPLELIGSYPSEAIETSAGNAFWFFIGLIIDLLGGDRQWVTSISFPISGEEAGKTSRIGLVWQGIANSYDIARVKTKLDRVAIDIYDAIQREDSFQSTNSLAPVLAECERVNRRNKTIRYLIWFAILIGILYVVAKA